MGARDAHGYGVLKVSGRMVKAHRWSYENWHGALDSDKEIDHICHNRGCVNPEHLRQVTKSVNQHNRVAPRRDSSGPAVGVRARGNRYAARIKVEGVERWLGTFDTADAARDAVEAARSEMLARAVLEAALADRPSRPQQTDPRPPLWMGQR